MGSRIIGDAEVVVDFVVRGFARAETFDGDSSLFQSNGQSFRLGADVGMVCNVKNEKGRNAFSLGDVSHSGVITMLHWIIPKLLPMPIRRQRKAVRAGADCGDFNKCR